MMKKETPISYAEIIESLYALEDQEKVHCREKKFGIVATNALGIYHKELKLIAKEIGHNDQLALQLFNSGIYEGRLLCSKIFNPKNITEKLMEEWIVTFENWEICDSFSMGLFAKSALAVPKILEWTGREGEFEKRAGFATMAAYCLADKTASNDLFEQFLPIIKKEANDDRFYVKKAVNWALRNIGKRNIDLYRLASELANELLSNKSSAAKWIAKNAIQEFNKNNLRMSDYPRAEYRKPKINTFSQ